VRVAAQVPASETAPLADAPSDRLQAVQAQVEGTKQVMNENISKQLANSEATGDLEENAQMLSVNAESFKGKATTARRMEQLKNWKMVAAISAVALLFFVYMFHSWFGGSDDDDDGGD
jgi:hypothetical protein